jgi:L-aspartate oxidase
MEMHRCQSEFVYLDLTSLDAEHVKKRFPRIYSTCLEYNLDITTDLMPVRPAAHYAMGGVATDLRGATDLEGLYAAGEVAATGVHGANRLASNSLLEGLVYGAAAARAMIERGRGKTTPEGAATKAHDATATSQSMPSHSELPGQIDKLLCEVRSIMWDKVGVIRKGKDLQEAVKRLQSISLAPTGTPDRRYYEAQNVLEVARLIARSALAREESRGAHYRTDFPLKNDTAPPQHSFVAKHAEPLFAENIPGHSNAAAPRGAR